MIRRREFIRREFIKGALALAALEAGAPRAGAQQVPNSVGTNQPKTKAPAHAADCHMHIYDPARFPFSGVATAPANAAVAQYRLLQKRNGTSRVVIVTPRNYVVDNRATVDAIAQLGIANARGVAVVHPTITDAELKKLNDGGIRGIRFSIGDPKVAVTTPAMIEPLAKRVASLGWHIQLNMTGTQIMDLADVLRRVPTQMVFDHLANPPLPAGVAHPSHAIVRELLDKRQAWVKLSGAYSNTKVGPPAYPEATAIALDFVKAAPERLVWGSDWPHPGLPDGHKPDDALLFDLLAVWAPDEAVRNRILVNNPETVYGFAKSA
jgi:D-galactarolactone isomerase